MAAEETKPSSTEAADENLEQETDSIEPKTDNTEHKSSHSKYVEDINDEYEFEEDKPVDYSQYIEDINDEYEFEESPIEPPAKKEAPGKRPVSPVVKYHKKTMRNSYMLVIAGLVAAAFGAFSIAKGGLYIALSIFIAVLGLIALGIGMTSVQKTRKTINAAQREFARDRAMRIYLACSEKGIEDCKDDKDKDRILVVAAELGFTDRSEAVGLYDAGRKLIAKGDKPNPDYDSLR